MAGKEKMSWDKHPLPLLTSKSGSTLNAAVKGWRKGAAQATVAATKGQWLMVLISSLLEIIIDLPIGFPINNIISHRSDVPRVQ